MTPLDRAYVEATQGGKESVFYNAFLSSTIFIATGCRNGDAHQL